MNDGDDNWCVENVVEETMCDDKEKKRRKKSELCDL